MQDGPVIQEVLQQAANQQSEDLAWAGQVFVLPTMLQKAVGTRIRKRGGGGKNPRGKI